MSKKEIVMNMFDNISGRYDFLNHFLSFGTDYGWRRKFVSLLSEHKPLKVLDVATGTGDLAIAISKLHPEQINGIDISEGMLEIAKNKITGKNSCSMIRFSTGDAENIPFSDDTFDAVTVAFGVRNYENLQKGLSEMRRVLKPGGVMQILEFSQPSSRIFGMFYRIYSKTFIPLAGKIISGNKMAYSYLPDSVAAFPSGNSFLAIMKETGLQKLNQFPLTMGIATIYTGKK